MPIMRDPHFGTPLIAHTKYMAPMDDAIIFGTVPAPRCWATIEQLAATRSSGVSIERIAEPIGQRAYEYPQIERGATTWQTLPASIVPGPYVATLRGGVSYGRNCVAITADNIAVRESGNHFEQEAHGEAKPWRFPSLRGWRQRWKDDVILRRRLPRRRRIDARVAILNMRCSHNYYHWLLDVMGRIGTLRRGRVAADFYLVDCVTPFQRNALAALGINEAQLIQPHFGLSLQAEELLLPCFPTAVCLQTFRRELLQAFHRERMIVPVRPEGQRLFISRRQANTRRLGNERDVVSFLREHGFETHCLEDYSLEQQCQLLQSAEMIVAAHGAGLANLIFARPDAAVIEIVQNDRYNIDLFPRLSRVVGLSHCQVIAPRAQHKQVLQPALADLKMALDQTEPIRRRRAA